MENLSVNVMDELGRILIPNNLRQQLDWVAGTSLYAVVDEKEKALILAESSDMVIDGLGRITIPQAMCEQLGFGEGDNIAVVLDLDNRQIKLTVAE